MWCFVQWYVKVRTVYVALLKQRCKISVSSSSIGRAFCIEPEVVVRFPSGLIYFLHRKLHLFSHNITINENNISQFRCYSSCTWATIAWSHNALCDHVQSHPQMSAGCFMQILSYNPYIYFQFYTRLVVNIAANDVDAYEKNNVSMPCAHKQFATLAHTLLLITISPVTYNTLHITQQLEWVICSYLKRPSINLTYLSHTFRL